MGFGVAMAGLKAALIPMLVKRRTAGPVHRCSQDIRRVAARGVRGIAEELHVRGIRAPRGDTWHPTAVVRLLNRIQGAGK